MCIKLKGNPLLKVFIKGFLYFFSLDNNPVIEYSNKLKKKSDADRMREDWYNVGNDIRSAYEKYKAAGKPC